VKNKSLKNKTALGLVIVSALGLLSLNACDKSHPPAAAPKASAQAVLPHPVASIHDIMVTIVDANADEIWDSTGITITKAGEVDKRPKTDVEWEALRRKALLLTESANLLAVKGRNVVNAGQVTSDEHIKGLLDSKGIQRGIDGNFDDFSAKAYEFQDKSTKALRAIEHKDADELYSVGGQLERACESCHIKYWYPIDKKPDTSNAHQS
jgi:hypothetical protein